MNFSSSIQVNMLQGELALMSSYKESVNILEKDKSSLENQIVQLEQALSRSQANANVLENMDTSGITPKFSLLITKVYNFIISNKAYNIIWKKK